MHEMQYIGFKIKTTAPDRYYVSPRLGSIPPQSELQLTLTRQPQSSFTSAEDRFLIEIATLPENSVSLSANELPPIEQQVFLKATVVRTCLWQRRMTQAMQDHFVAGMISITCIPQ